MEYKNLTRDQLIYILKTDVGNWNKLREAYPDDVPELNNAELGGLNLSGADLSQVSLIGAKLQGSTLTKANLNLAKLINADCTGCNFAGAQLNGADLIQADLTAANLSGVQMIKARLAKAVLTGVNLNRSDLSQTDLGHASLKNADMVKTRLEQAVLTYANLSQANLIQANLTAANLSGAVLSGAGLSEAVLLKANLSAVNAVMADFNWADLSQVTAEGVNLERANLNNADCSGARFNAAVCREANFCQADLSRAAFLNANLIGANFSGASLEACELGETIFGNSRFADADGLEAIVFRAPCILDHRTIEHSPNMPAAFFRGCGIPNNVIQAFQAFKPSFAFSFICFSRYSADDEDFANQLTDYLRAAGVRCWLIPYDKRDGRVHSGRLRLSLGVEDRLIPIVSPYSMNSQWLKDELRHAYQRENKYQSRLMIPARLVSDTEMEEWQCPCETTKADLAKPLKVRPVVDFSQWREEDQMRRQVANLLLMLKCAP